MLKIGGPDLLVVDVCEDCGEIEACYIDSNGDIIFNAFPPEAVVRVH